jgi:hypothetical protein
MHSFASKIKKLRPVRGGVFYLTGNPVALIISMG